MFSVADLYCLKLFFTLSYGGADPINTILYCVIIDYLTWFDGLHVCDM